MEDQGQFVGSFSRKVDAQRRVSLPAGFRVSLREERAVFAVPFTAQSQLGRALNDPCLIVVPKLLFRRFLVAHTDFVPDNVTPVSNWIISTAEELRLYGDSRIRLSRALYDHLDLRSPEENVLIFGLGPVFGIKK